MKPMPGAKGIKAEEALRSYFLQAGYFVVRGIPFVYRGFDVTDIDIWLYIRSTSLTRERTCVDIKRKKTPQAIERVFWTRGLREVLGLERAIVVTSDNREETRAFGSAHGITVLHGGFVNRILNSSTPTGRITEEEFFGLLKSSPCITDSKIIWHRWYRTVKSKLIEVLNFDGCNQLLLGINLALKEYISTGKSSEVPVRLLYILVSYFLLCLDYASRGISHLEPPERRARLTDGLRFGQAGRARTKEVAAMALNLIAESGKASLLTFSDLEKELEKQLSEYAAETLSDYFAKSEILKNVFDRARTFERLAYSTTLTRPTDCNSDEKAVLGVLCDFFNVDRKEII
jgi:hypothetical protein